MKTAMQDLKERLLVDKEKGQSFFNKILL